MKNVTIGSLTEVKFLSDVSINPDGKYTAWVESMCDEKNNKYKACIYIRNNMSGETRKMTSAGEEFSFLWDGADTLLFAAERRAEDKSGDSWKEKTAYYRLNVGGGEAEPAFSIDKSVSDIRKAGDGLYVFTAPVDLYKPEEKDEDYADYHVFEEVPFWGNGRGFIAGKRMSLFLFDEKKGGSAKLSADHFQVYGFDVKDGKILYYGQEYRDVFGIYDEAKLYDIASGDTKDVVKTGSYMISGIYLTASGILAAMSTMKTWGTGEECNLYRMGFGGEDLREVWHNDGTHLGPDVLGDMAHGGGNAVKVTGDGACMICMKGFRQEIYFFSADDKLEKLTDLECNISMLDTDGKALYCVADEKDGLNELYELKDGKLDKLTDVNGAFLKEHAVSKAEYAPFTDSKGVTVDGWVLKPFDYDPEKTYPGILEIHGGPRCAYTQGFFHEMQALAGNGYFVFFCNPHGSEGYGEEFADLRGKYGTVDYDDLMEFTDHVLAAYPQIDPERLGAAGGSYGGFMCNWIEGHTDRFAAIASQRSISNWVADFGSSEIGITFDANEMGATPWDGMERMWAQSPLKYANKAKTPILFIHSLCDYNCPIDQGAEMFSAMKYFGVPARMCVFEGENHSLSRTGKPRHRIRRLTEIMNWFDKYLK